MNTVDNGQHTMTAPEPPAELLSLVRCASPAMQEVRESIARFGYAHTAPGVVADADVRAAGLHVVRGLCIDCVYENTPEARAAMRGDENLEQLRRLPRVRSE